MKLIEDDGEVIHELPDECALLIVLPERELGLILPARDDNDEVGEHELLAAGLGEFLRNPENVRLILTRYAPKPRSNDYKAN